MTNSFSTMSHKLVNGLLDCIHLPIDDEQHSAIAISVGCGHFDDEPDCEGLAHLLEHMLFMGNEFAPTPNQTVQQIEQLGGSINAYTAADTLSIQCRFPNVHFEACLEILANLLTPPLFRLEDIDTEIATIDAEFQFKRQDDLRRLYQVHKETCNQNHPFSQFSVGNAAIYKQWPNSELQQRLRALHMRKFTAANTKICCLTNHPAQLFFDHCSKYFQRLDIGERLLPRHYPPLYLDEQLGVQIWVNSLSDTRRLIVTFALPGMNPEDMETLSFISHLLGDESQGSILSLLRDKNWVVALSAGGGIEGPNFKDFNINLQLTESGELHTVDIIHCILRYLDMIRTAQDLDWRIKEKHKLSQLFKSQLQLGADPEVASQFACGMFKFSADTLVQLHDNQIAINADQVRQILAHFTVQNLRLKRIALSVPATRQAKWYETPYHIEPINPQWLKQWATDAPQHFEPSQLLLPKANPYIGVAPDRRKLPAESTTPAIQWQSNSAEIWSAQDKLSNSKADGYVSFECPFNSKGPEILSAKRIWLACLNEQLQERFYAAEVAGLNYRLYGHQGGFSIHTSGFGYKQKQLMCDLVNAVFDTNQFEHQFERIKHLQLASLRNNLLNKPVNRLFTRLGVLMQRNSHSPQQILACMEQESYANMRNVREQLLSEHFMQGFLHGAWRREDIDDVIAKVESCRTKDKDTQPITREVIKLQPKATYFQHVESIHDDSAALIFLQAPSNSPLDNALTMIFEQLLATPFFDQLRTRRQLGYIVGSGYMTHNAHPGMAFYIQSPNASAERLIREMTQFLMSQLEHIDYYEAFWPKIKANIIRQLVAKDVNTGARAQRCWISLGLNDPNCERQYEIAQHVHQLNFSDMVRHAQALQQRQSFGELVLFSHGKHDKSVAFSQRPGAFMIESSAQFKQQMPFTD